MIGARRISFLKVTEEFGEMTVAFRDWSREAAPRELPKEFHTDEICRTHIHLMEECTDLIIATVGLMERMGADEKSRARYMKEANVSNAKRDGGRRFKHD